MSGDIDPDDFLGCSISESNKVKATKPRIKFKAFRIKCGEISMDHLPTQDGEPQWCCDLIRIAEARTHNAGPNRVFYGWAVLTKRQVEARGNRQAYLEPECGNPHHVTVKLCLHSPSGSTEDCEDLEEQLELEHRQQMAEDSMWFEYRDLKTAEITKLLSRD